MVIKINSCPRFVQDWKAILKNLKESNIKSIKDSEDGSRTLNSKDDYVTLPVE